MSNGLPFALGAVALLVGAGLARAEGSFAKAVTFADVPMGEHRIGEYTFTFMISRWSLGKVSVGFDGRETLDLIKRFNPTYSHRAGYSLSPSQALRLLAAAGGDVSYMTPKEKREKAEIEKTHQLVSDLMVRLGGVKTEERSWRIPTEYGSLDVSLHAGSPMIFARFADWDPARSGLLRGISRFSGKWNHIDPVDFAHDLFGIVSDDQRRGPVKDVTFMKSWKKAYPELHTYFQRWRTRRAGEAMSERVRNAREARRQALR